MIELARENLNPDLQLLAIVLNIADMRTRHSREAFDSLRQHFGDKLLDTTIRQSIAYAESAERALSILDYRPDLAADYLDVASELLKRLGLSDARKKLKALFGALASRSERRDARSERLELHDPRPRPSRWRLRRSHCISATRGSAAPAPDQHRRAGARDRRAERAELGRPPHQLRRARVQMRPVGLVQAVAQAGRDQIPVRRGQPGRELGDLSDVADRIAPSAPPAGSASRAGAVRTGLCGITITASSSGGHLDPAHIRPVADHETAEQRRGDVVRMALDLGRERQQRPPPRRTSAPAASSPATTPAALEPMPPLSGIVEATRNSKRSAGSSRSKARTIRLPRSRRTCMSVSSRNSPVSSTSTVRNSTERGGQHVEAGTEVRGRTRDPDAHARSPQNRALDRAQLGLAGDHASDLGERSVGILEPVAGEHARNPLGAAGAVHDQSRDRGRGGRLAEDALLAGKEAVGLEDLLVGDGVDRTAG